MRSPLARVDAKQKVVASTGLWAKVLRRCIINPLPPSASDDRQRGFVGDQSGGRVFLFLKTDDFARDHAAFVAAGVRFTETPREEAYGTVTVFEDLYGNRWDLVGPSDWAQRPG